MPEGAIIDIIRIYGRIIIAAHCFSFLGLEMKTGYIIFSFCAMCLLIIQPAHSADNKYEEDFFTTDHRDQYQTTCWWDTDTGELKMYPFIPSIIMTWDTSGWAMDIEIAGDYAYLADGGVGGLRVLDISAPWSTYCAGYYDTDGTACGVDIEGDWAYVADGTAGLVVIDISNPVSPVYVSECNTPGYARDVTVDGNYAYITTRMKAFR